MAKVLILLENFFAFFIKIFQKRLTNGLNMVSYTHDGKRKHKNGGYKNAKANTHYTITAHY